MQKTFIYEFEIDWEYLRQQKTHLIELCATQNIENLEGIITLIDSIQDSALKSNNWSEEEIFGIEK